MSHVENIADQLRNVLSATLFAIAVDGKNIPLVQVALIEGRNFGAKSKKEHWGYLIEISLSSELLLRDAFLRILTRPDCLPDVGDMGLENNPLPVIRRLYTDIELFAEYGRSDESEYYIWTPKCAYRDAYSEILVVTCLSILMLHELAHVLQGHITLKASGFDLTVIQQMALEQQADFYSVRKLAQVAFNQFHFDSENIFWKSEDEIVKTICRAFWSLFLFNKRLDVNDELKLSSHSHPRHRQTQCCYALDMAIRNLGFNCSKYYLSEIGCEIEICFRKIVEKGNFPSMRPEAFRSVSEFELLKCWQQELRPILLGHSYIELSTAGPDDSAFY